MKSRANRCGYTGEAVKTIAFARKKNCEIENFYDQGYKSPKYVFSSPEEF